MGSRRSHAIATLALAGAATLILGSAPSLAIVAAPAPGQPDFDARSGERADIPAATADAREALAKLLGAQAIVSADPVTGGLRSVARTDGLLTGPSTADPATIAIGFVRANADAFGLDGADLAALEPVNRSVSPDGVTHLTFGQLDGGIGAYDSALTANVTADGRLINAGGAPVHDLQVPSTDPPLGPAAARTAARRDLGLAPDGETGAVSTDPARTTRFSGMDRASLVTLADPDGDHLAWKLTVAGESPYIYEMLVDAASGAILTRHSLTDFASSASVVEHHPQDGSLHTLDLPGAWLSVPIQALNGPNAHAYADRSAPDGLGGDSEVGPNPSTTDFDYPTTDQSGDVAAGQHCPAAVATICTWDGTSVSSPSVTDNVNQVTTQVFYYVNKFHDWLKQPPVGFTPAFFNFETGGPGGDDPVDAETDDYGDINNANMATPPDGQPGRMQMYLFKSPFPAVNGGDDASVVYHEYAHGLTNRLVGHDGQANGLLDRQSQAMGEGWSDWYAMDFLTADGHLADTAAPGEQVVGAYVTDNPTTGIRENAIDCPVGAVAPACPGTAPAGPGGFTFADLGRVAGSASHPNFEVHADGEIWAETLWDLRRAIGPVAARTLITSALRLAPKQPTFLDMRDAILLADLPGAAHRAQIWSVFAARGMGYSASTTSANATRATAAFDTPPVVAAGAPDAKSAALEQDTILHVPILNPSTTPLTGVRATLSATTAGVTVPAGGAVLGTIGAGATATATFAVRVAATAGCGSVAGLSLAITTDQGPRTVPLSLPVGTGSATAATRSYAPPVAIPDNQPAGGLTSTVSVPTHGRVGDVRLTLTAAHPWIGDLHAWLTSPAGTTVDLFERPGTGSSPSFSPANLVPALPLVLTDGATGLIQDLSNANVNTGGALRPNEPLARFSGEDRFGTWTLRITDASNKGAGTLTSWSLETAAPACAVTDAPTGLVADGATFHARIDPGAAATTAAFELGATAAYGARSPAVALTTGGGLQNLDVPTGGLTAGATYHVRAIALRNGVVVAAGADRSFVAGVDSPPVVDPGPETPVTPLTPVTPGSPEPPAVLQVPKATMKGMTRTVRLDRKGRFAVSFIATPAKARGTVKVAYDEASAGSASFTAPAAGRVKLTIKATNKIRSLLRKRAEVKTKVTVRIGVTSLNANLTIKPYKKPKR